MQNGNLIDIDDQELIQMAIEYNVMPIMFITALNVENGVDIDIVHSLITDTQIQDNFISNILSILHNKGYYGISQLHDTSFTRPITPAYPFFSKTFTSAYFNIAKGGNVQQILNEAAFQIDDHLIRHNYFRD